MKKYLLLFLSACGVGNAQVFSENFNSGALPSGWTVENPSTAENWQVGAMAGFASFPSGAAFFDDDAAGGASINTSAKLISPVIDLTGVTGATLSFKYANMTYEADSSLTVEAFNGTSWVQVFTSSGDSGTWGIDWDLFIYAVEAYDEAANIDLSAYANANFKLRFVYNDAQDYSYGVVVDDVLITSALGVAQANIAKLQVYPNPVKDNFQVGSYALQPESDVAVFDVSGRKVKAFKGKGSYDVSDLGSGIYTVSIKDGEAVTTRKIVKN